MTAANTNYCATTYQVRACDARGCSPWSTPPMTQVLEIKDGVRETSVRLSSERTGTRIREVIKVRFRYKQE